MVFDRDWWANDGVVNTISMKGPKLGSADRIVPYHGTLQRGVWNDMGIVEMYDHLEIVGFGRRTIDSWYLDLARLLASLPE